MTLEELIKQATPLPWHFADRWTGAPEASHSEAEPYSEAERKAIAKILANKRLADHAVNMLPKLVIQLKRLESIARDTIGADGCLIMACNNAAAVLAEADNPPET